MSRARVGCGSGFPVIPPLIYGFFAGRGIRRSGGRPQSWQMMTDCDKRWTYRWCEDIIYISWANGWSEVWKRWETQVQSTRQGCPCIRWGGVGSIPVPRYLRTVECILAYRGSSNFHQTKPQDYSRNVNVQWPYCHTAAIPPGKYWKATITSTSHLTNHFLISLKIDKVTKKQNMNQPLKPSIQSCLKGSNKNWWDTSSYHLRG